MTNGNLKYTNTHNLIVKKRKEKQSAQYLRKPFPEGKTKCLIISFKYTMNNFYI